MAVMTDQRLGEALETYRAKISILKKGREQEAYRIEQIARSPLGEMVVRQITSIDIASYRDDRLATLSRRTQKAISPATVRLELSLLSNFFDIARIEWGLCDDNPVKNVRKPKIPPGRERRLTPREERQILRYCHAHPNPELGSIVVLALETAMRQGEILHLQWENISLKAQIAHLPDTKNGTRRDVPLSIKARDHLIRLGVKSNGPVFSYGSSGIKSTWRLMTLRLGINDLHFHDLRHEAVSRLFELGTLDMMEIAAISGHKSLSMLKRYTHLKAQRLVRKLEGNKSKGRAAVVKALIPYPAEVRSVGSGFQARMLDFDDLAVVGQTRELAMRQVQHLLLQRILLGMREGRTIPEPDQYLDLVDEEDLVMIDPLGDVCAQA